MKKLRIGLVGAGRMGAFHAETIEKRLSGAELYAVADPVSGAAEKLIHTLGSSAKAYDNPLDMFKDSGVDGVVIASPARTHAENIIRAAQNGKAVFCEKPMAVTIEEADRVIQTVNEYNVPLQVGFNRRFSKDFRSAHHEIVQGDLGTPQLLRSLTRDPVLADPAPVPEWTIFLETLIHDFDVLNYLNPGALPIEVYAVADALVRPDFKERGFLDTAVVTIKYDNGAIATAEANFQAVYGYDVRAEAFGSKGMMTIGSIRESNMTRYNKDGVSYNTLRYDQHLLHDAYVEELASFVNAVQNNEKTAVGGEEARMALLIARACIESVMQKKPIQIEHTVSNLV
ncbi:Gfo/Idh/MocA family oxidoreductase [Priestia filamentosa]|uniref:Gfo/Idh/MocA family oxidoreductase n=1 Tax=Priestia filamentosa TaxID=1402861 RepID=UPI0002ECBED1|nr:Gfo/Idh/MocA family oxidoreductase [Priestia filamentosa]